MYNGPFKWWVQSVMPLVFDDSLSYYEVLAKLTKYIEGLTGDVEQIEKILATIEGIGDVTEFTKFLETIQAEIGNLDDLQTPSKTNLVSAINEVVLKADIAYWKPPTGIPESDLSQEVQEKLNNGGSSSTDSYIINNVTLKKAPNNNSPADLGLGTYSVPEGGIPWDTLSKDVQDRIDAGGGGTGGTKDYTELINKPEINGHTLNAGNNSSESLGLGTYSKPAGGIPESDMSAEVQEKLNTSGDIADSESGFIATRNYKAGDIIYINGVLYRVEEDILTGTTLVPGNNIKPTTIDEELKNTNSEIEEINNKIAGLTPFDSWNLVNNDVVIQNYLVRTRVFTDISMIGNGEYIFKVAPKAGETYNSCAYSIRVCKNDGTVIHTESVTAESNYRNEYRFTVVPEDTGSYYVEMNSANSMNNPYHYTVTIEYTMSQGITELWNKINEADDLEERVGALETLVEEQQTELDGLSDIPQRVEDLETDVDDLRSDLNRESSRVDTITEHTYNIFNANSTPALLLGANVEYMGNDVKIISNLNRTYTGVVFKVDVSDIDTIFVNPYTYEGNGLPTVRVGVFNADETAITPWLGVSDPQNGSAFDVSSYDTIGVCLYARYNTGAGVTGEYIVYKNVSIVSGNEGKPFIPYYSAVDINLRNELELEKFDGVTIDVINKSLANVDLWEGGTIDTNSGENKAQNNSIRLINYIEVDNKKPLYLQAYYVLPTDLVPVANTDNYNMRNMYIYQYDKYGNYLSRTTITSAKTLSGDKYTLSSQCKYIRLSMYTRVVNTVIETIMPGTIYIDSVNSEYWLPPYYDDYLINKASDIEQYARSSAATGNVFVFITDQHAPQYNQMHSPSILRRLAELTHLPIVFCGGDVDQNGTLTYVYCDALRDNFNGEIHHAVGNHDFLSGNTGINLYYDMDIYNKNQIGNREHHYYYVDDVQRKTRYIVLAAYRESEQAEGTGEGTVAQGGYTNEQIAWINNVALDMPADYTAIVFTHYFYTINKDTKAATLSYGTSILRSLSADSRVLLVVQGHTHFDRIIKEHDEAAGALPIVITSCDKNIQYNNNEGWTVNRATGTVYEQCFDVIILNKDTRTAHIVRIGGLAENGVNDSVGTPSEERMVTF